MYDDVHLAGPSTTCIPTSPDVGETVGIRFAPGVAAGVLRFNPAEVRDLAAPLRDVVGAIRAAEVARVLRVLRSFGTAPGVDLLAAPADGWVGLVRRAAAAGAGAAQVAGEIGWSTRHLRRRMLAIRVRLRRPGAGRADATGPVAAGAGKRMSRRPGQHALVEPGRDEGTARAETAPG